jgi:hypothetical protein
MTAAPQCRRRTNVWVPDWDDIDRLPDNGGLPGGSGHYETQTDLVPLAFVAGGSPGPGQYSLSGTTYVFNAAESGKTITIFYSNAPPGCRREHGRANRNP